MANEYEVLSPVDFGTKKDENGEQLPDAQQPDPYGLKLPGEKLSLSDEQAEPLMEAKAIKPADHEGPFGLEHDNPEEHGYAGEAERKAQAKNQKSNKDKKE